MSQFVSYPKPKTRKRVSVPQTDAQKLAVAENFAIFTLKGMLGNLNHVRHVVNTDRLYAELLHLVTDIKFTQYNRKQLKKKGSE